MSTLATRQAANPKLLEGLRRHALKIDDVVLSNGTSSSYYVDVKQAMLLPGLARIAGEEVARIAHEAGASAVGGMIVGAIPIACATLLAQEKEDLVAFIVRKDRKEHGLQKWIEGPDEVLKGGARCLVVDDVVTTGRSTIEAIERVQQAGLMVAGVVSVVDRLAGGGPAIEATADAPYRALVTIDELYPDRPDRG
jgi:orotate phosphoribosyltransferase